MTIFMIEYNRPQGRIIELLEFSSEDRPKAEDMRLQRVLDLHHRGVDHDVVLLEASSMEALRKTHRRYFGDITVENVCELLGSVSNGHS